MYKTVSYIIVMLLLHCALHSYAQDEYSMDTVIVGQSPVDEENSSSFSAITQTGPVEIKKLPQQKLDELKNDESYWYANTEPPKKEEEIKVDNSDSFLDKPWVKNLLWIIILCSFIGVVIWYLASGNVGLFRRESKKIVDEEIEEETDDIFSINYEKEIQKAVGLQNYRAAIRFWYLRTLRDLSERKIIDYRYGKTNHDYVSSLYGGRFYQGFFSLTRHFEYTWYGQFKPSAATYEMMQADFVKFKNTLA